MTAAMLTATVLATGAVTPVASAGQNARAERAPETPDPGRPGPYRTTTGGYDLSPVTLPDLDAPVAFGAVVVAPSDAPGPLPVVVFLHGQYPTCFDGPERADAIFADPCPDGYQPIRSDRGFLPIQELLASHGFLTVSVDANGVNAQDAHPADGGARARSSLVRRHLDRLAGWAAGGDGAPEVLRNAARADLSRVVLVGHSRGGDGVSRAAMDSRYPAPPGPDPEPDPDRWRIRGLALLAPTSFGHNPVPDVPSMVVLPNCDGDVARLDGQAYVDATRGVGRGTALHSAVYLAGANHNWFNSEWTPGQAHGPAWDDFTSAEPDARCTPGTAPGRLTAAEQQATGAAYVAAAARLFGLGEDAVRPLLDGSGSRAASAGRADVRTHALGGRRSPLVVPDPSVTATGARVCRLADADPATSCGLPAGSPHGVTVVRAQTDPSRYGAALSWTDPGAPATLRPDRPVSLAGAQAVALRVVVPPNSTGTRLEVAVADQAGRRAVLGEVRLDGIPGTTNTFAAWAQEVRVPLDAAAAVDLAHVAELVVVPRSASGRAWLLDAWGWQPGTAETEPAEAARVDLGSATVAEGADGAPALHVPATVTGTVTGQVWLAVVDGAGHQESRLVDVRPGTESLELPLTVPGDREYGPNREFQVRAWAARDAVIGANQAEIIVRNDDPLPPIEVVPVADRVTEGGRLAWRFTLAKPLQVDLDLHVGAGPRGDGAVLSTVDVDPDWLARAGQSPQPERPLARGLSYSLTVPAGAVTAELAVPTVADDLAEPDEHLRLGIDALTPDDGLDPWRAELVGTVLDR